MGVLGPVRGRLFGHDLQIAVQTLRATFAGWQDRLTAGALLFAALAGARSWLAEATWQTGMWTALGAGILAGLAVERIVGARLAFHGADGVLAADVLHPPRRRRFIAAWHAIGLAMLAAVTLIVRPSLLVIAAPAYLAGALTDQWLTGLAMRGAAIPRARLGWAIRQWLRGWQAGLVAATILLASLLSARTLSTTALIAVVGVETLLLTLPLVIVDDSVVRFMTMAGHGAWRIVRHHAQAILTFMLATMPVCLLAFGPVAAGIVAAASIVMLFLLAVRLLAYRLYSKRFADLFVSIQAAALLLVAYAAPIALPLVAAAMLWQLQRRGAAKTWLLR